jgi:hypothetical protein
LKRPGTPVGYWDYSFTGMGETFIVPETGTYLLEAWGGGAQSGRGGYSKGEITLTQGEVLYGYVGPASIVDKTGSVPSWNGGGGGGTNVGPPEYPSAGSGAGGTDFRTVGGNWDEETSLYSRFLVAGGAGGNGGNNGAGGAGGTGGGTNGGYGSGASTRGGGASQTAGGTAGTGSQSPCSPGSFGYGSRGGGTGGSPNGGGGGGGGWYGGGGADNAASGNGGGGGGSGWVNSASAYTDWLSANSADADKYAHKDSYRLTNGSTVAGNVANGMPDWRLTDTTMTGNAGNGHARITLLNP